jgi:predicted nucleotidyltransferase
MTNTSLDISGKIDGQTAGALAHVKAAADSMGMPIFLIGALARDIFLKHIHGLPPRRLTKDIDFGASVATWGDFDRLRTELIIKHGFEGTMKLQELSFGKILVDIIPFGAIAGPKQNLFWPPDQSFRLSTVGFEEAYKSAPEVKISLSPAVYVKVCSLPALVILKLISWHERYPERQRDAEDVLEILDRYEQVIPIDRLYLEDKELISEEGFDNRKAAIRLLGRDMARIAGAESGRLIISILERDIKEDSNLCLAGQMARGLYLGDVDLNEVVAKIAKLKQGFEEIYQS